MISKTKRAEKLIMKFAKKQREPFRLNLLFSRYRAKLPMTFAAWNLRQSGDLKRTKQRGFYVRG
jgi:hypothetical protein